MQETPVPSLGWEDPLEKGKATHSNYSCLENSMDYIVYGVSKSRIQLSEFHFHHSLMFIIIYFFIIFITYHPYVASNTAQYNMNCKNAKVLVLSLQHL